MLDELNKYAPREGTSPIKDVLVDIASRGRSLGVLLIGAQQSLGDVARPITTNAALKVVGRLDACSTDEYRFLTPKLRERAALRDPAENERHLLDRSLAAQTRALAECGVAVAPVRLGDDFDGLAHWCELLLSWCDETQPVLATRRARTAAEIEANSAAVNAIFRVDKVATADAFEQRFVAKAPKRRWPSTVLAPRVDKPRVPVI